MIAGRRIGLVALLAIMVAGCSGGNDPVAVESISWETAASDGFLDDVVAGVFLSSDPEVDHSDRRSHIVFIRRDGSASILKSTSLNAGTITSNRRGHVMFSTEKSMRIVASGSSSVQDFPARSDLNMGHWSNPFGENDFVTVFNTGEGSSGYETDIYATQGSSLVHSVMPDVPDSMGLDENLLYSLSGADSLIDGGVTLYVTDLRQQDSTRKALSWQYRQPDSDAEFEASGNIFAVDKKLFLLETINRGGATPGDQESVRLAEVDPVAGTHASTEVATYPHSLRYGEEDSDLGYAASGGHLYNNAIYTVDHAGIILAVDLGTKRLRAVGAVGTAANDATEVVVAWRDSTMTVLYTDDDRSNATLENYDLNSGKRTLRLDVPELAVLLREDDTYLRMWSATSLP